MAQDHLIEQTLRTLSKLPKERAQEVADFADFLLKRHEEEQLQEGVQYLVSDSDAFSFVEEEEELYSKKDLKEKY